MKYNHLKVFWSIFNIKNIDAQEKLILLALLRYAGANNKAWPSYNTLATITALNRSTIIRKIKSLHIKQYIFKSCPKRNVENHYALHIGNILDNYKQSDQSSLVAQRHQQSGTQPPPSGTQPPNLVAQRHLKNIIRTTPIIMGGVVLKEDITNITALDDSSADAKSSLATIPEKQKPKREYKDYDEFVSCCSDDELIKMLQSPFASTFLSKKGTDLRVLAIMDVLTNKS